MPNWMEGSLKVRGTMDKVERFFREGLEGVSILGGIRPDAVVVKRYEYSLTVRGAETICVKGTKRAFVDNLDIGIDIPDDPEEVLTVAIPIRQAWTFREDDWKKISKDFHIDLRLYGFERGAEFEKEIEIIDGVVTINHEITYDDYAWESKMPFLGG